MRPITVGVIAVNNRPSVPWIRLAGILTTIPVALGSGPLIGWWIGQWLDRKLGTDPFGLVAGLLLGVGASVSQTIRLVRLFTKTWQG